MPEQIWIFSLDLYAWHSKNRSHRLRKTCRMLHEVTYKQLATAVGSNWTVGNSLNCNQPSTWPACRAAPNLLVIEMRRRSGGIVAPRSGCNWQSRERETCTQPCNAICGRLTLVVSGGNRISLGVIRQNHNSRQADWMGQTDGRTTRTERLYCTTASIQRITHNDWKPPIKITL